MPEDFFILSRSD